MTVMTVQKELKEARSKVAMPLLWIAIVSMIMLFGAWTSAYYVSLMKGNWIEFSMPVTFYVSTALLLVSSVFMNRASAAVKKGELGAVTRSVMITFLLGAAFAVCQVLGWSALYEQKIVFAGKYSNPAGSFFYLLTFMHLLHIAAGMLAMGVVWYKSARGRYTAENHLGLRLCAIFWHFLDVLWIYLFLFLLLVR